ncbi:MAG TPA: hypothetical protein VK936_08470, partial [Longimicrobiales bacterium]|nr:hypothetical protein [Longimicrobiales bacterium]
LSYLAGALWELGEFAVADSLMRAVMDELERGEGAGRSGPVLDFLYGLAKLRLGHVDSADAWFGRVLADTTGAVETMTSWTAPGLAHLRIEQGRLDEAREHLSRMPTGSLTRQVTAALLTARLLHASGDAPGAARLLEDSIARILEGAAPGPPLALPLVTLAEWRLELDQFASAEAHAARALQAAAPDILALERSGYAGRAHLVIARSRQTAGDAPGACVSGRQAASALASAFGPASPRARGAAAVRDSVCAHAMRPAAPGD